MTHFTLPGATPWLAFIYHQEIKKKIELNDLKGLRH